MSAAEGESAQILEEITSLLSERVIRVVPREDTQHGFYSRYFVIPIRCGGLRPILDLRNLNKHLRKDKFKTLPKKHYTMLFVPETGLHQ